MNLRKPQKVVKKVGGYELLTRLGEGGCGTVFKARQPGLDRLVALKILAPKLSKQKEYLKRFHNEAKSAGAVNHLNIVQVLAAGYDQAIKVPYIVYEFVDGVTLTQLIESRKGLPEHEALAVVKAIASALGELKRHNIVHRDLKPDNILVTRTGVPKLTDLGLAKQEDDLETLTETGIVMGTPDYMAPEQATGKRDLDITTDIYALGLTLYVMLTARLPYYGQTLADILRQHIQQDCPDPRLIQPNVSSQCVELLAEMTRRDRTQRYRDSAELLRDIERVKRKESVLGPKVRVKPAEKSGEKSSKYRRATGRQKSLQTRHKTGRRSRRKAAEKAPTPANLASLNESQSSGRRKSSPPPAKGIDSSLIILFVSGLVTGVMLFAFLRLSGSL